MLPSDRQARQDASKPLTPALSSAFRNTKSPLTPKVTASPTPSPSLSSARQAFVRSKSPSKSDPTTTPLGGNITPRSSARKSRVGTESPLTPAQPRLPPRGQRSRAGSGHEAQKPVVARVPGLGITSPRLAATTPTLAKAATPSPGPVVTIHRRPSTAKSLVERSKDISSKFFHASEARSAIGSPGLEETQRLSPKPGHFFVGSPPLPSARDNANQKPDLDEKFFRADDIQQNTQSKRPLVPHVPEQKPKSSDILGLDKGPSKTPPQSPKKNHNTTSPALVSPRKYQPGQTTSPALPRTTGERPKRTSSGGTTTTTQIDPQGHRKSLSASSISALPTRNFSGSRAHPPLPLDLRVGPTLSPQILGSNLLSPETLSPRSISLGSTNTVPTSVTSDTDVSENAIPPTAQSVQPADQKPEQQATTAQSQTDQASNARRERKVLDLEISNSSLLAINKTLECELRKQSTQLRRYQRLSRSGRLSFAPSTRTVSEQSHFSLDTVAEFDSEDHHISDFDGDSDADDLDDGNSSLLSNESGSASLSSPFARSRQRARDEKRLIQDLSRHQQLLIDSQKLSQSINRCLTSTEDLIREGNKALDYRVGIGDVKIGGKVLNDEELDERGFVHGVDELEARQGLLSPSIAKANLDHAQLWANALPTPPATMTSTEPEIDKAKESTGITSLD